MDDLMDGYGSSILEQWPRIVNAVESSQYPHHRVLDVGAGWGKGGILLREYLNVKPGILSALEPNKEAFAHQLCPAVYDVVWSYRLEEFPWWDDFDTVVMADVIEHVPWAVGREVLDKIRGQIIISTPVDALASDNTGVPELERHVSQWDLRDFNATQRLDRHWVWLPAEGTGQHIVRLRPSPVPGLG